MNAIFILSVFMREERWPVKLIVEEGKHVN